MSTVKLNLFADWAHYLNQVDNRQAHPWEPRTFSYPDPFGPQQLRDLGKLLLNGWSAEYALRITPVVNDDQYLKSSLHWTFPQAYYAVLFTSRALLMVRGYYVSSEGLIAKRIASFVQRSYYPVSLGVYVGGFPSNYPAHSFRTSRLQRAEKQDEVVELYRQCRGVQFKRRVSDIQSNPKIALRNQLSGTLFNLNTMPDAEKKQVSKGLNHTTFFDVLARLRISSTERSLEEWVHNEGLDIKAFHADLVSIVEKINRVHEAYVLAAVGHENYERIVSDLPSYLRDSFVRDRTISTCQTIYERESI
ncbi:hypothetical protein [Spirosoma sordidisoli]|uniref:Uncharacterized protein n=1 Tax=Spirosoma sordidisoli TaxID=2502893 RepID=A0A4V1RWB3_9BACT|nr:hypothetical protein [Spirosoma sordidisoli]RYC69668.1 hypothetical protein EQG79_13790 [Spirosoma sordidisoli]